MREYLAKGNPSNVQMRGGWAVTNLTQYGPDIPTNLTFSDYIKGRQFN